MNSKFVKVLIYVFVVIFSFACSSFNYSYKIPSDENDGLNPASLESVGLDSLKIIDLIRSINNEEFINVHSILISKNNKLVFEEYFDGNTKHTKHSLRSAAKSLTSALTGIAIDKGYIKNSDQKVLNIFDYPSIKNWDKRKRKLKIKHLLTMSAGLDCGKIMDPNSNCGQKMNEVRDPFRYILDLPIVHEPGEHFAYSDAYSLLTIGLIGVSTNMQTTIFQEKYLLRPLGIEKDPNNGGISSRSMLKFGLLYLNKGTWNGERIVSEKWINESTGIHVKNPNNYMDGYGYYWWHKTFEINGNFYNTFFAAGNGGQYIFIIPQEKLVVVLTGGNYVGFDFQPSFKVRSQPYYILADYILPALPE